MYVLQNFRPLTRADKNDKIVQDLENRPEQLVVEVDGNSTSSILCEESLTIHIINVWDSNSVFVGLTGLEVIGETGVKERVASIECPSSDENIVRLVGLIKINPNKL